MKFLILFTSIVVSLYVTATESDRLGVVSSAGGRVRSELTCQTLRNARYQINNLVIYDSSINNPKLSSVALMLQFSLDSSSRHPSCDEREGYQRFSLVVENDNGYVTYIDPRHRGRSGHHFVLEFKEKLSNGDQIFELSSPTESLPCANLLPRGASITLICK